MSSFITRQQISVTASVMTDALPHDRVYVSRLTAWRWLPAPLAVHHKNVTSILREHARAKPVAATAALASSTFPERNGGGATDGEDDGGSNDK